VVLQPYKLTSFLLVAPIHFVMGAPEWVPQTKDTGGETMEVALGIERDRVTFGL
jgi:hypothetical protein